MALAPCAPATPHPPRPASAHAALRSVSGTDRAWRVWGAPRSAPSCHPTTTDPSRGSPWAPCGASESRYWQTGTAVRRPLRPGPSALEQVAARAVGEEGLVTGVSQAAGSAGGRGRVGLSVSTGAGQKVPLASRWFPQVSESGVHRPHVAGIHGRSNDGAYSLVLAGGYEDDVVSGAWGGWYLFSNCSKIQVT